MGPYYDRKSVTAAYRGNLGLWFRCPSVGHELFGPLPLSVPGFAWRAQFAAGDWYLQLKTGDNPLRLSALASGVLGEVLLHYSSKNAQ